MMKTGIKGYILVIPKMGEAIAFTDREYAMEYITYWYLSVDATRILVDTGIYRDDDNKTIYHFSGQDINPYFDRKEK